MREAPQNWYKTHSGQLNPVRNIAVLVHGDDYVASGSRRQLQWLESQIRKSFEIKAEYLGPRERDKQECRSLNRIIRYKAEGLEYEADPRQHEIILEELGLC